MLSLGLRLTNARCICFRWPRQNTQTNRICRSPIQLCTLVRSEHVNSHTMSTTSQHSGETTFHPLHVPSSAQTQQITSSADRRQSIHITPGPAAFTFISTAVFTASALLSPAASILQFQTWTCRQGIRLNIIHIAHMTTGKLRSSLKYHDRI